MNILIAGFGDLGHQIALELQRQSTPFAGSILALRRRLTTELPTGFGAVTTIRADLTEPATLATLPDDISHAVYCATADSSTEQAYQKTYFEGLSNLIDKLSAQAVKPKILFVSSTAVYGREIEGVVDESSPTHPARFNGKVMLAAEQMLLQRAPDSVVLRLSGIYGPGRTQLLRGLMAGTTRIPDQPGYWANRIHIEDAARAVIHLLSDSHQNGVFIGTDSHPLPLDTLYTDLAMQIGAPAPQAASPSPMMGKKKLSNRKLLSTGFEFKWPDSRTGYQEVIKSYFDAHPDARRHPEQ